MNNNDNQSENIYQFQTTNEQNLENNQRMNVNDPLGVSNERLVYEPGIYDEQVISKVFQMPTRILGALIVMGVMAFIGFILLIIGLIGNDKSMYTILGVILMVVGGVFSLILVPTLMRNKKMTQSTNRDEIRQELGKPHYYLKTAKTYFTENYVISLFSGKIITKYSDIIWIYDEARNQTNQGAIGAVINMGLGATNIVLVLSNQKKYRFPGCNENAGIFTIVSCQNTNVIIGRSREAKDAYKQFKNNVNNINNQINNGNNYQGRN